MNVIVADVKAEDRMIETVFFNKATSRPRYNKHYDGMVRVTKKLEHGDSLDEEGQPGVVSVKPRNIPSPNFKLSILLYAS